MKKDFSKYLLSSFADKIFPIRRAKSLVDKLLANTKFKDRSFSKHYFESAPPNESALVTDRTWADLEMDHLFKLVDRTITPIGSQFLYGKMRRMLSTESDVDEAYNKYILLMENKAYVDKARSMLSLISDDHYSCLARFIYDTGGESLKGRLFLYAWAFFCVVTPFMLMSAPSWIWLWIGMICVNVFVLYKLYWRMIKYPEIFKSCLKVAAVANQLDKMTVPKGLSFAKDLEGGRSGRARLKQLLKLNQVTSNPIISSWSVFLNVFFLLDPIVYALTSKKLSAIKSLMEPIYHSVGEMDASFAIATYLENSTLYCKPSISSGHTIEIVSGAHPLIEGSVLNSINTLNRSVIVLGSNMGGKTTFIKMVGINFLLSRTLGFSHSKRISLPMINIMTSINGYNSVLTGKSLFFDEVSNIKGMISSNSFGSVLIIDELFSGTNTLERVAACQAVLKNLSEKNVVFVTTHDLSLVDVLSPCYSSYYFEESDDLCCMFTFKINCGVPSKGNAIALLSRAGFPDAVITSSLEYMRDNDRV